MDRPVFSTYSAFVMPQDEAYMNDLYWSPAKAAKEWGCSRATAYRLIDRYGDQLGRTLIWVVKPGKTELRMVIRAKSQRPEPPKGNPAFRDSQSQSAIAHAREGKRRRHERKMCEE